MSMRDVVRQLLTDSDNVTHDLYRYMAVFGIVTGLGLQVYAVGWHNQPFDMQTFGIGTGALFAGVGVALGLKKDV
ncbi:MAG: hypothetical protein NTW48_09930 [Chloroflexi bacterium]|nr:hypothetical protein [Chloroflexota bacterium]